MGPNNLCYVTLHFLLFFFCPMSLFIRTLLRHITFYKHFTYIFILWLYCLRPSCWPSFSIKFQYRFYNFYKSYSFYQSSRWIRQLLKWPCHTCFFTHVEAFAWLLHFTVKHHIVTCTRAPLTLVLCITPAVCNTCKFAQLFLDANWVHWVTQNVTPYMYYK